LLQYILVNLSQFLLKKMLFLLFDLLDFRRKNAAKKSGAKTRETEKKRKAEENLTESQTKTGSQGKNLVESG
jgi:hypothetical protein